MQFKVKHILLSFLLTVLFSSSYAQAAPTVSEETAIQNAVLVYINEYRAKKGLSSLKMDNRLVTEARGHSLDMAKHKVPFGHTYFNQRIKRLHTQIKNSNAGAENVAYNYKDAQNVVKNWLLSPGHKANIDGNYSITGVGVIRDSKGKLYFTQIFLRTGSGQKYAQRRSLSIPFFRRS